MGSINNVNAHKKHRSKETSFPCQVLSLSRPVGIVGSTLLTFPFLFGRSYTPFVPDNWNKDVLELPCSRMQGGGYDAKNGEKDEWKEDDGNE